MLFGRFSGPENWSLPTIIISSGSAWATRRFRGLWMGVTVQDLHGVVLFVIATSVPT